MYDVIFIGSGHASWHGAVTLAQAGKKVAIIEKDLTGGTRTNYGCDAKILLDGPFEYLDGLQNYADVCVSGIPAIDWKKLMDYKKREADDLHLGLEQLFPAMGIEYIRGQGRIADPHTVQVGDRKLETEAIVIATGQRGARVDVPGKEYLHDSREFLSLEEMPDRLVFLGAGIISLEFALPTATGPCGSIPGSTWINSSPRWRARASPSAGTRTSAWWKRRRTAIRSRRSRACP